MKLFDCSEKIQNASRLLANMHYTLISWIVYQIHQNVQEYQMFYLAHGENPLGDGIPHGQGCSEEYCWVVVQKQPPEHVSCWQKDLTEP